MAINRDEFEKAYKNVFGKDRDLSQFSDINLSDFKEVLLAAVEEFDKTAPPEPEECRDIVYIFWRVHETVFESLQNQTKNDILNIFESNNFFDLNNKASVTRAFVRGPILLCNLKELERIIEAYIECWLTNRKALIKTGRLTIASINTMSYGMFPFTDIQSDSMSFYPIQNSSDNLLTRIFISISGMVIGVMGTNSAFATSNLVTTPAIPVFSSTASKVLLTKILSRLSSSKYKRKREPLYNTFSDILKKIPSHSKSHKTDELLEVFVNLLYEIIGIGEIELYLQIDRLMGDAPIIKRVSNLCIPELGSITKIIRLIGYYEKEVKLKMIHTVRNDLKGIIKTDSHGFPNPTFESYFELIGNQKHNVMINSAIEKYLKNEKKEEDFWGKYYCRVNDIVAKRYAIRDALRLENDYKPILQKIREEIIAKYQYEDLFPKKETRNKLSNQLSKDEEANKKKKVSKSILYKQFTKTKVTSWSEVVLIVYKSFLRVLIEKKNGSFCSQVFHFSDIGCPDDKDEKKDIRYGKVQSQNTPTEHWVFIRFMARRKGRFQALPEKERSGYSKDQIINIDQRIYQLDSPCSKLPDDPDEDEFIENIYKNFRQKKGYAIQPLQYLLGLEDDPLSHNRKKKTFKFLCKGIIAPSWEDVSMTREGEGAYIKYDIGGLYKDRATLFELGCTDEEGGALNDFGRIFIKILRCYGNLIVRDDYVFQHDGDTENNTITSVEYDIAEDGAGKMRTYFKIDEHPFQPTSSESGSLGYKALFKTHTISHSS